MYQLNYAPLSPIFYVLTIVTWTVYMKDLLIHLQLSTLPKNAYEFVAFMLCFSGYAKSIYKYM